MSSLLLLDVGSSSSSGSVPGPPLTYFRPVPAAAGASLVITGSGLTGTTAVTVNGISAVFVVDNDGQITATVPAGGINGLVTITVTNGGISSIDNSVDAAKYADGSPVLAADGSQMYYARL